MNLKDKLCYPSPLKNDTKEGLTFRERLIIAIASGDNTRASDKDFAENCIRKADEIIKQLEEKRTALGKMN